MIRLLFFAPAIAILGVIFMIYMTIIRPVVVSNEGKNISANDAIKELKGSLGKIKSQQDIIANTLEAQRQDLILESANATKLYEQVNRDEYADIDLIALKSSITSFNQQALELAGNETAIIAFNDQLRDGVAALDRQIRDIDIADLLHPKEDVANRLNSLRIQTAKLVELQKVIIAKSKEYNERSREAIADMKVKLKDQAASMEALKTDKSDILKEKIKDNIVSQDNMLLRIKEQSENLSEIRKQNLEQMQNSKERVTQMMEQMQDKMTDARQKSQDNEYKMQDAKDKANDAKQRALDAKQRAKESQERAKEMQQALKDRMNQ